MADTVALSSNTSANTVDVLDLTTQVILTTLTMTSPGAIAVLPDASEAYITNNGAASGLVYPIALPAYTAGASITVGSGPLGIAASPDGTHVYSGNALGDSSTPIATPSNIPGTDISFSPNSISGILTVDPASANLYLTTPFDGIIPVAIPSNVVGASFGSVELAFNNPSGIIVMPGGTTGYVGSANMDFIWPVDFVAQTVGVPFATTGTSGVMFLQPGGTQIFCCDSGTNDVFVFDTGTNTQTHTITLTGGSVPTSGGFDPLGNTFYACCPASGEIFAIDTSAYTLGPTFTSLTAPRFMAIVPAPPTVSEMIVMIV